MKIRNFFNALVDTRTDDLAQIRIRREMNRSLR